MKKYKYMNQIIEEIKTSITIVGDGRRKKNQKEIYEDKKGRKLH